MKPVHATLFAALASLGVASAIALVNSPPEEPVSRQHHPGALLATVNPPPTDAGPRGSPGHGNALWAIPLPSLTATEERPIFSPSRRPPVVIEVATAQPKPSRDQPRRPLLSLVGAIAGDSDGIGIFLDEATKRVIRVKTGESYSGWTLRSVTTREAILQKGPESAVFSLPNPPAK